MDKWKPKSPHPLPAIRRYGLAVLSVGLALAGALLLSHFHFRDVEVPLFLFAVAITSWYGGPGPVTLAVFLSAALFDYFFTEPLYNLSVQAVDLPYYVIFLSFALLIAWFSSIRR